VQIENQPLPVWIKISALYLFLPLILFAAGWLKPGIALPLLVCILGSIGAMLAQDGNPFSARPNTRELRSGLGIAAIAFAFAILAGLPPWVPQSTDYLKHNLILGDLIERPWPVRYAGANGGQFLCYGLGYYMIPAAIAKLLGTSHAEIASFWWATLGLFLFFCGVGRGFSRNPKLGVITVLLCSGLGAFWTLIKSGFLQSLLLPNSAGPRLGEGLMDLGLYTSNLDSFTRILYQPQHGIVGWLGSALIYELVVVRKRWPEAASILAATLFWSPLTALALAVIGAAAIIANPGRIRFRPTIHILAAFAVTGMLAAYYLPHVSIAEKGFIWQMVDGGSWVLWYLLFLLFFVCIPCSAVWWLEKRHNYLGPMKPVVIGMTLVLIISPLFKLGQLGDLRMQLSGPAFLFIALAMAKGLIEVPVPKLSAPYIYLSAVFLAGAMFPVLRTVSNLMAGDKSDYRIATLRKNHLNSIMDLRMPGFDVTAQYLGNDNSRAAGWILKPPPPR
jgi:hypothetical protein